MAARPRRHQWTFTIRDGVTFSNGAPFTAEDAAFSIDRAVNSDLGCNVDGYVFGDEKLELDDPRRHAPSTVSTEKPDPILPLRISFVEIVPPADQHDREGARADRHRPVRDRRLGRTARSSPSTRNETYWGTTPAFARAEYQWRSEGSVRAAMITNDETDIATSASDPRTAQAISASRSRTTRPPRCACRPPSRRSTTCGCARRSTTPSTATGIVKALFRGLGEPAAQLIPSGVVGYNDQLKLWPHDPDKAKQLSTRPRPTACPSTPQIRLIGRTAQFPKIAETIEVIQSEFAEIGLNVKIEMMDTRQPAAVPAAPVPARTPARTC